MRYIQNCFLIFLFLVAIFNFGCASSRDIKFFSKPEGAVVSVDSKYCITPCTMMVDCDSKQAIFANESKEKITAEIPSCDQMQNLKYVTFDKTEKTLKAISIPFGAVGFIGLSFIGNDFENNETTHRDTFLITAGSFTVATIFYFGGEIFNYLKGDQNNEVIVEFKDKNNSKVNNDIFETMEVLPDKLDFIEKDFTSSLK